MLSSSKTLVLLTLSVAVSGVQGYVPHHRPSATSLVCHEDSQLRALERFSSYADDFCPEFLAETGRYPRWLDSWNKKKVSSACSCYEKTATSHGAPSTAPATGTLSLSSTAPVALSSIFATTKPSGGYFPSVFAAGSTGSGPVATGSALSKYSPSGASSGGYIPSASASGVLYPSRSLTGTAPVVTSSTSSSLLSIPNRGVSALSSAVPSFTANSTSAIASMAVSPTAPVATGSLPAGDNYPPQPPGAGPGKRGLCYDNRTGAGWSTLFKFSKYATYGSNGGYDRGTQLDESFSYVPTLVVDANLNNNEWNTAVPVLIEGGTKALFLSNKIEGTNLTAEQAATVYKKYMQPYAGTVQLGTPTITNGDGELNLAFLESFVSNCAGCNFNFVNVEFFLERESYSPELYAQALKTFIDITVPAVQANHPQLKGLPIFLGAWWLNDASLAEGGDLMDELLPYLDGNANVLAYQAAGGLWEGDFINADATGLTPAGQKYNTWPSS